MRFNSVLVVVAVILGIGALFNPSCRHERSPTPTPVFHTATVVIETPTVRPTRVSTERPTSTSTAILVPSSTPSPSATPSKVFETVTPTSAPTSLPTVTPMPNLGTIHVNEAVNARDCPGVVDMCPVVTMFFPGYETVVRATMTIEDEDWLAVDHPLGAFGDGRGRGWVWVWVEYDPEKSTQSVEYK